MKFRSWALILLAAAPFLDGCAAFWAAPAGSTGGGCTTGCSTAGSGFFYILNAPSGGTPQVVGEQFISGKVTAITGGTVTMPAVPYAMAVSPNGNFLYVSTAGGVYVYPVTSGALGTASQVSSDATALAIQVDPSGDWLIEALQSVGGVTIAAVPLNTSNGTPNGTEQSTTASITNATIPDGKMVISPDDKYIFIALGAGGTIIVPFNASAASGTTPFGSSAQTVAVAHSSGSALSVAVDPGSTPRLFYIGETLANTAGTSGGLRVFEYSSIGSGTLVQASGSPIASGGLAPNSILPVGSSYVYVANGAGTSPGNITSFAITTSGSTYTIATGSTADAGIDPYALAEDGTDTYLLAVNQGGSTYFSSYTFNSTTAGELVDQVFTNTGTTPLAIVAVP